MFEQKVQLSVFLENKPGALSKLSHLFGDNGINILAMAIQDPVEYIQGLFRAREVTLRRIASPASYGTILQEASRLTLVRFVTSEPDRSLQILTDAGYSVTTSEVILTVLENHPGELAGIADRLAEEEININFS